MFTSSTFLFVYGTLLLAYIVIKQQCVCDHGITSSDSQDLKNVDAVISEASPFKKKSPTPDEAFSAPGNENLQTEDLHPTPAEESSGNSGRLSKENLNHILNTLANAKNDDSLISAVKEAGEFKVTEAIHLLGPLLDHSNLTVCEEAAQSLGQIGDTRALKFLFSSTDKLDSEIQRFTTTAREDKPMVQSGEPEEIKNHKIHREPVKKETLAHHGPKMESTQNNLHNPEAEELNRNIINKTPPLDRILPPLRENNFKVLDDRTPYNLNKLSEDQMTDLLLTISCDENEQTSNRYYAIKNLAYFTRKDLAGETAILFGSPEPAIRFAAADTVARIGGKEASSELIKALHDENPYVRSSAASGLATLGDDRSLAPLLKLKNDKDEIVRFSAERALNSLSEKKDIAPLINRLLRTH